MNKLTIVCCLIFSLFFCSCNNNNGENKEGNEDSSTYKNKEYKHTPTLHVYLYGNMTQCESKNAVNILKAYFQNIKLEGSLPLPDSAYYKPRHRYLATILLNYERTKRIPGDLILGITNKDISYAKQGQNYGIFGLSYRAQGVSVVSTYRIKKSDDFTKLMLHELGHACGLPHCAKSKTCIMRDAKGKNHFPGLTDFCPTCKSYLKDNGWIK